MATPHKVEGVCKFREGHHDSSARCYYQTFTYSQALIAVNGSRSQKPPQSEILVTLCQPGHNKDYVDFSAESV